VQCGKALNERKAEIRIQFQKAPNALFADVHNNELVIRIQPNEAMWIKVRCATANDCMDGRAIAAHRVCRADEQQAAWAGLHARGDGAGAVVQDSVSAAGVFVWQLCCC
jgi:glucose-6-phosphate 1-dehydrogenase